MNRKHGVELPFIFFAQEVKILLFGLFFLKKISSRAGSHEFNWSPERHADFFSFSQLLLI